MAENGISTEVAGDGSDPVATKIKRREDKLALAAAKRSNSAIPGYRPNHTISGTHQAYVNGIGGPQLVTLSGSAPTVPGGPWSTGTVATYFAEFRTFNTSTGLIGDTTSTCNEGEIIAFDIYGTNIPASSVAYLQFGGANITNQDSNFSSYFPFNLLDPIPLPGLSGDIPPGVAGAPLLINADNLTEGNETLTLTWYLNSTTVATATSISIVDTSLSNGLSVTWAGTNTQITPTGSYTSLGNGAVTLDPNSFVDVGQTLSTTTFTVTIDANMSTGGGGFWNTMWGNDNYGGPAYGEIAYWNGATNLNFGNFSAPANATTSDITADQRRIYTFVFDGINASFYVNGILNIATTMGSVPAIPANTFYIGSRHNNSGGVGPTDSRGGTYYSAIIHNTALDAGQVLAEAQSLPGYTPPPAPYSLSFNGTNNYIEVQGLTTDWNLGNGTIEFWSNAATSSVGTLYTVMSQGPQNGIDIFYDSGKLMLPDTSGGYIQWDEPTPGVWTHVAIVSLGGGDTYVYYNGVLQGHQTGMSWANSTDTIYIGRRGNNNFQYFNGKLTDIRITASSVYTNPLNLTNFDPYSVALPPTKGADTVLLMNPTEVATTVDLSDSHHTLNATIGSSSDYPAPRIEHIDTNGFTIEETLTAGNLTLYARASSFQVNPHVDALIAINGSTAATITARGHTLMTVDSSGGHGPATTYDTYGDPSARTALVADLNSIASGFYIVLTTYDACSVDAGIRSALTTGYGATDTLTWDPTRYSHIFIGQKL